MFILGSSGPGEVNDIIYDAEGAREGQYGCTQGLIWVHVRANIYSHEQAIMGLGSQAVSARITKHFITIFVKRVIKCINK